MAAATIAEQQGLQRAIARAIEKEDRALGRIVGNETTLTTYTALWYVAGRMGKITSTDRQSFQTSVNDLQKQFPKLKITVLEKVEKKPLPVHLL